MKNRKGFTLAEVLVVVVIVGVLAAIAVPSFNKTIEASRATDAENTGEQIRTALKGLYLGGNSSNFTGDFDSLTGAACPATRVPTNLSEVVSCGLIPNQTWTALPYKFTVMGTAGSLKIRARRRSGDFSSWTYDFSVNSCNASGGAPSGVICK